MSSYIDLEDENLIEADENELYVAEENLRSPRNGDDENENPQDTGIDTAPSKDATKVAPKKRVVKNPQPKLNYDRLKGPRGLLVLESSFKDVKFRGKGYEKEDLDTVMSRLEQWAHRLFPKYKFEDTLSKLEQLGHKKQVSNFIRRIRLDMIDDNDSFVSNDIVVDNDEPNIDPFDRLTEGNPPQNSTQTNQDIGITENTLTDEQRERMIRNRLLAEERRLARMKAKQEELARKEQSQRDEEMQTEQCTQVEQSVSHDADVEISFRENRDQQLSQNNIELRNCDKNDVENLSID